MSNRWVGPLPRVGDRVRHVKSGTRGFVVHVYPDARAIRVSEDLDNDFTGSGPHSLRYWRPAPPPGKA